MEFLIVSSVIFIVCVIFLLEGIEKDKKT